MGDFKTDNVQFDLHFWPKVKFDITIELFTYNFLLLINTFGMLIWPRYWQRSI